MDHRTIEESGLIERYLQGTLPLAEREELEDHYLDCAACLERLELTRRLRSGLAQVAVEEGARSAAVHQVGLLAALARLARSRSGGLLAAGLLLAALAPAGLLWRQSAGREQELGEERAARRRLEERQRREPSVEAEAQPRTPSDQPERQLAAARRELAAERERAAAERAAHGAERQRLAGELAEARGPQAHTTLVTLGPERSGGGEPAVQLTLPPAPSWVVLALDVPPSELPEGGAYRAALRRAGRRLWQSPKVEPDGSGAVLLSLHSSFLSPGDYDVDLVSSEAKPPVASYRFRVRPPAGR
jgi:hypothetical protein